MKMGKLDPVENDRKEMEMLFDGIRKKWGKCPWALMSIKYITGELMSLSYWVEASRGRYFRSKENLLYVCGKHDKMKKEMLELKNDCLHTYWIREEAVDFMITRNAERKWCEWSGESSTEWYNREWKKLK
jgi:hypothetical protein